MFTLVDRWFWLLCIVITFANAAIFRVRAQRRIRANPELADGYSALIRGFVVWGNIPWLVMGIGRSFGGVASAVGFMRPRDGNPFVLAFFGSILLLYALGTIWLFFRGGAEMLVKHPGMLNVELKSPRAVKIAWCLSVVGGIGGFMVMFAMDPSAPAPLAVAGMHADLSCRDFITPEGNSVPCRIAFDVASEGYSRSGKFAAFGLIFVAIGSGLVAFRKRLRSYGKQPLLTSGFAFFYLGFSVLWTTVAFIATFSKHSSLVDATRENRVETLDGIVTDFVPMPASGHATEHFCVSGKCFDYSDYNVSGGFNNTSSHGGPIGEGLPVRVTCVGNDITRLEVAVYSR